MEQDTYIIPGMDNVVVGGTLQKYDTDLEHREEDSKAVWERACTMVPSLQVCSVSNIFCRTAEGIHSRCAVCVDVTFVN